MVKPKVRQKKEFSESLLSYNELILYNDEVNTFDFVIDTLIDVCDHDPLQAEQCTVIVHFKGKCAVHNGSYKELKPKFDEMSNRGLTVAIE
ncbi:ATP-dependent Clp protease adaptor ClpS [candidate division KSB1 bacterium]